MNNNSRYTLLISIISALGGYLFGFDFAVIAGTLPFLKHFFELNAWWEGFLTGILALGCMVGCVIAGRMGERFGRKPSLMLSASIFAISSLGMALADSLFFFMLMRFMAGIGVGMASILSPLYIAEVSPASIRGRNVSINQLTIVFGILITNLVNYAIADLGENAWRWMFGLGLVPSLGFLLGLCWLPESPRWLLLNNQKAKAITILNRIGGESFTALTLAQTAKHQDVSSDSKESIFSKRNMAVLYVGIGLAVFQQLCGINVVFNYTAIIFETVGADLNRQLFETVAIGVVNVVFTIAAMFMVDKLGRKPLMLFGSISLATAYLLMAILLKTQASAVYLSIVVMLAISIYASTLAPVTWVLISEIFPNNIRGKASSFSILCLWGAYFILVFTFPILAASLGTYGPFMLYAVICVIGFIFIKMKVKETKGKTLEQLEDIFVGH